MTYIRWILPVLSLALVTSAHARMCKPSPDTEAGICPTCTNPASVKTKLDTSAEAIQSSVKPDVSVYATLADQGQLGDLKSQGGLNFHGELASDSALVTFDLDPKKKYQKMQGFGGAMTEACAMNMAKLPPAARKALLERLFSKSKGAGLDLIRLPMGTTDFSDTTKPDYTYDDTPGNQPDPQFTHFDMSRDSKSIALIREAKKINPNLKVMISPWSPPAWMKNSKSIRGGQVDPKFYPDLANYFVKVIREYEAQGVPVGGLTIQNEPGFDWSEMPTTGMSPAAQAAFIRDYLGPTLKKEKIQVPIYIHDHNWDQNNEPVAVLSDPGARKYVGGVAYHCYGGSSGDMMKSMRQFPKIPTLQTECSGTMSSDAVGDFQWWLDNHSVSAVNMGTVGSIAWNLCLDENGGPHDKATCNTCRGMVTTDFSKSEPQLIFNGDYSAFAQVSRFIQPGSRRIEAGAPNGVDNPRVVAFLNPNGTISVIAQNAGDKAVKLRLRTPDCRSITYDLPALSAASFQWNANSASAMPTREAAELGGG